MVLSEEERQRIIEEEKLRMAMRGKSTGVALVLSFFVPGLGDLYCGSFIKAFIFFGLGLFGFILLAFLGLGVFILVPVWFAGLYSAYLSASKSEKRSIRNVERDAAELDRH